MIFVVVYYFINSVNEIVAQKNTEGHEDGNINRIESYERFLVALTDAARV